MKTTDKDSAIDWAITKLRDCAAVGDLEGIERIHSWAKPKAKGSADRKERLREAYESAKAEAEAPSPAATEEPPEKDRPEVELARQALKMLTPAERRMLFEELG